MIRRHAKDGQRIFVGVTDPLDPRVETPEEISDRILEAARYIPARSIGNDGRLRICALQRRHVTHSGNGVRQDSGPCRGDGIGQHTARSRLDVSVRRSEGPMQEQRDKNDEILDRLNRRLRTLYECTGALFQAESEQELLQSICDILVAGGEFGWPGSAIARMIPRRPSGRWPRRDTVSSISSAPRFPGERGNQARVHPALRFGLAKRVGSMISGRIRALLLGESPRSHTATPRASRCRWSRLPSRGASSIFAAR